MTDRIPQALKDSASWTVSGATKIPLDPFALFNSNIQKGYSPSSDKLMPLDPIKNYLDEMKNPALKAAIQLTEDIPYVIVDIEPEGMLPKNPYFKWPYLYTEYSRNHGLHGILPFDPPPEYEYLRNKFTVKDELWDSEILIANGHFATFTFNELPLNQYEQRVAYAHSKAFQLILSKHLDERTTHNDPTDDAAEIGELKGAFKDIVEQPIHPSDYEHMSAVLAKVEPLMLYPSDDKSKLENRKILQAYGSLIHQQPAFLSKGALATRTIPVLWKMTQLLLEPRGKHNSLRNSKSYGRIPWLAYIMLDAIEYVRNQSLHDPDLAHWVTKDGQETPEE